LKILRLICVLAVAAAAQTGLADYPDRPIKVLMPFPPGGTVDVVTRLVCNEASEILGKPLVLDYRPGAAGIIATEATARSQADGYTVLVTTPNHTINPALRPKLPFNTERDFVPVSLIGNVPELLIAHPSVPFDTLEGLVAYARANPGKLSYSSAGIGTLPHVTMELLLRQTRLQVTHVAYKGAAPALTDLLAGVVQLKYDTYATTSPLLPSGKVKVIASAGRTRLAQLPNIATVAESGFPGYEGYLWIGVLAPRGTPQEAVSILSGALARGARSPKVAARFQADGVETPAGGPQEFGRLIAQELALWARVVRESNITVSD
jgi:tripartite-type tricarboxylate transporter receptor subunit TctC